MANGQETINNYGSLKFDANYVKTKMDEFKGLHPNATKEQLSRAEKTFVAGNVILKTRLAAFDRTNYSRLSEESRKDMRYKVGVYVQTMTHTEMGFFANYEGEDFADRLIAYQNTYSKAENYRELGDKVDEEYKPLLHVYDSRKNRRAIDTYGVDYERGLFDPETDSKGVRLDDFSQINDGHLKIFNGWSEELERKLTVARREAEEEIRRNAEINDPAKQSSEKQELCDKIIVEAASKAMKANQAQVDSIKIPVPKNMTPALIRYAVIGETLSEENIDKTSAYLNAGSTIVSMMDLRENYKILFFSNMYADDARINTHSARAVIPDARKTVKTLAENGDTAGLTSRIRNSFDIIFASLNEAPNPKSTLWNSQVKSLLTILKDTQACGIDLQLNDMQKEKVAIYEKEYAAARRMRELEEEISEAGQKFILSEGTDKRYDPKENPELFDKLIELDAYQSIFTVMVNEMRELDGSVYHVADPKEYNNIMINRTPTKIERIWKDNEKGLLAAFKDISIKHANTKKLLNANTFEEKKNFFYNESKSKIGIGNSPELRIFGCVDEFERVVGDYPLIQLRDDVTEIIKKLNANTEKGDENLRRRRLNALNPVPAQIRKIQELRSKADFSEGVDQYDTLSEAYEKLGALLNDFINTDSDGLKNDFFSKHAAAKNFYEDYGKNVRNWRETQEFFRKLGRDAKEYEENRKTLFEQTFGENKRAFDTVCAPDSRNQQEKEFYDSFMRVKSCLDEANKKDTTETPQQRESRNRDVRNAYRDCIDKADNMAKNGRTNGMKFFAKNLKRAMDSEETKIATVSDRRTVTFNEAFGQKLSLGKLDEEALRSRLKETVKELEKVSTRFPKNSEEFDRMLTSARRLTEAEQPIPLQELLVSCRVLRRTAQKYITAKSVYPSTEKGQKRLELAKTLRDLCGANLAAMQTSRDDTIRPKKTERSVEEEARHSVESRMASAGLRLKKLAANTRTRGVMTAELTKVIYLKKAYDSMERNGAVKTVEMMELGAVNKAVEKLRPMTDAFVEKLGKDEVAKIVQGENGIAILSEKFAAFSKENVAEKTKTNPEKTDMILTEKNKEITLDI